MRRGSVLGLLFLSSAVFGPRTAIAQMAPPVDPTFAASSWVNHPHEGAYANDAPADVDQVAAEIAYSKANVPSDTFEAKKIEVPLVFHILYDNQLTQEHYDWVRNTYFTESQRLVLPNLFDGTLVTEDSVRTAVEQLNDVYQVHKISFKLYDGVTDPIRYHEDPDFFWSYWGATAGDAQLNAMRNELMARYAVEPTNVLNVFVHSTDRAPFLAMAAFPSNLAKGDAPWAVNIDFRVMPGVWNELDPGSHSKDYSSLVDVVRPAQLDFAQYNKTLPHEVGHCLGLFHTFTLSTPLTEGDMVDDTPFEALPFKGDGIMRTDLFADYPIDRNTADDSWYWPNGKDPSDPVRNVMDYGSFHYREAEITKGQADLIFRQLEIYAPQFVTHAKPAKPAEDRMFIYADFENDDLSDGTVVNKTKHGKKVPIYIMESEGASLVDDWDFTGTSLDLQDSASLYVSEDDLDTDDIRQTSTTNTIAFWFRIGDIETMGEYAPGLPLTPMFQLASLDFSEYRGFDIIHRLPVDGYSVLRFYYNDSDGNTRFELFSVPTTLLTDGWTHLAITYDVNQGVVYYFNGYGFGLGISYGAMPEWTSFWMGMSTWWFSDENGETFPVEYPMNSSIDELAVYNIALSQEEVTALQYNGAPDNWVKGNYRDKIRPATAAERAFAGVTP